MYNKTPATNLASTSTFKSHLHPKTEMISAETVRTWIRSELPHLRPPSKGTLEALTEGSTTQPLWEFLTKRVLHPTHAEAAHAALTLSGGAYEPRDETFDNEIDSLSKEAEELQREVEGLRQELEKDDGDSEDENGSCGGNMDSQAICDVVNTVLDDRNEKLSEVVELLHVPGGEPSILDELLRDTLEPTEETLEALSNHSTPLSRKTLLETLQSHLSDAESRITAPETSTQDMSSVMEAHATDECLRAYKELQTTLQEHSRGAGMVRQLAERLGEEERNRLLWAQIEGEQAVLAYARESLQSVQPKAEVVSRDVAVVENACYRIAEACLSGLHEVRTVFSDSTSIEAVQERLGQALSSAEALVTGCKKLEDVPVTTATRHGELGEACDCEFRKAELQRLENVQSNLLGRLRGRRQVLQQGRDAALARFDIGEVEEAVRMAAECRDVHAVRVRDELVSFVRQPGRAAAPWLIGG